jgi:hypothetical protein
LSFRLLDDFTLTVPPDHDVTQGPSAPRGVLVFAVEPCGHARIGPGSGSGGCALYPARL